MSDELPDDTPASTAPPRRAQPGIVAKLGAAIKEVALVLVIALVISAIIRAFVGQVFVIPSQSMQNTLQVNDRVAVSKVSSFRRGDIVVFRDPGGWLPAANPPGPVRKVAEVIGVLPDSSSSHLIKRVIGMPGDRVKFPDAQGRLTVNGQPLDERDYLYSEGGTSVAPATVPFEVVVPANRLFVMGDHRNNSGDSRCHLADITNDGQPRGARAFVPFDNVVGPAVAIIAPLDRLARTSRPSTFDQVPEPSSPAPAQATIIPEGVGC